MVGVVSRVVPKGGPMALVRVLEPQAKGREGGCHAISRDSGSLVSVHPIVTGLVFDISCRYRWRTVMDLICLRQGQTNKTDIQTVTFANKIRFSCHLASLLLNSFMVLKCIAGHTVIVQSTTFIGCISY